MPTSSTAYIALGSNLDSPLTHVKQAVQQIDALNECQLIARSPWYQTTAIGPGSQPDYINGVIKIATSLLPLDLLTTLQTIESRHHRTRNVKWGPRTLDLDILLIDNLTINEPNLTIPHPQLTNRNFVILPLYDIAANLTLPDGRALAGLAQHCSRKGIKQLNQTNITY